MRLFEEYKLYEDMWDDTSCTKAVTESATGTSWDNLVAQADSFLDAIVKATSNENYDDGDGYWETEGTTWCNRYLYYSNSLNNTSLVKDLCDIGSSKIPNATFSYVEDDTEEDPVSEIGYTLTNAPVTESGCKGADCKKDLKEDASLAKHRVVLADYDTDDFDINVEFGMQDPDENEVVDYEYLLKPGQTAGDLVVWLSRDCGYTSIYVHDERPATPDDIKRLASHTFPVTGTGDEWQDYGTLDESLTEEVVDHSGSPGIGLSRQTIIHDLLQDAAVRKGCRVGTGDEELYSWLAKEDYYRVEFSAWDQNTAYSYKDYPQYLRNSSTSISKHDGMECFVGTLPEVTEVLNDVVAKGYEFEFITVSKLLINPPHKKYGFINIDEDTDEVFLLSFFDSWEDDQKEYQAPTIRFNKIFNEHEPFIQAIKNSQGYGIIAEAADLGSKQMSMVEAQAAKYKVLYSDRHTEIVDEATMDQLVDELESFTRDDILQIRRISSSGKSGKTIWTEEEGLL